jgi:hypothetical protein
MSRSKKIALVGVIVAVIVALTNLVEELAGMTEMFNAYAKDGFGYSLIIATVAVLMIAIGIALALLKVIAFKRLDTPKEKGWLIFLLTLGLLALLFAIQSLISGEIFNFALQFIQALTFVTAFYLKKRRINV